MTNVDTIFLSFCEDCERNDGTPDRPYFMTESLREIIGIEHKEKKETLEAPLEKQKTKKSKKQADMTETASKTAGL